ncbi:MAG: hypothetical protein JO280_01485 [Mycobacteriaceae bacterium]|nr:hypothetical protein [Mycobacteriaceae bacterium]
MTTTTQPQIPVPAGAVRVYDWDTPEVTGHGWSRYFVCASRPADENIEIYVDGTQYADGRTSYCITLTDAEKGTEIFDVSHTSQARALAAALVAVADDVEGWTHAPSGG